MLLHPRRSSQLPFLGLSIAGRGDLLPEAVVVRRFSHVMAGGNNPRPVASRGLPGIHAACGAARMKTAAALVFEQRQLRCLGAKQRELFRAATQTQTNQTQTSQEQCTRLRDFITAATAVIRYATFDDIITTGHRPMETEVECATAI